jgi:hypothetical protein
LALPFVTVWCGLGAFGLTYILYNIYTCIYSPSQYIIFDIYIYIYIYYIGVAVRNGFIRTGSVRINTIPRSHLIRHKGYIYIYIYIYIYVYIYLSLSLYKTFVLFWGAYHAVSTVPYPVQVRKLSSHQTNSKRGLFVHTSLSMALSKTRISNPKP